VRLRRNPWHRRRRRREEDARIRPFPQRLISMTSARAIVSLEKKKTRKKGKKDTSDSI